MEVKQVMEYEKSTKNTYRYKAKTDSPPAIRTLYIQKWALGNEPPTTLTVTVTS